MPDLRILGLTFGNLVVAFGCPIWDFHLKSSDMPLEAGAAVIAVMTFFCVWLVQRDPTRTSTADSMRDAIAASFVVTYLVMVSWCAFFGFFQASQQEVMTPLTQQFTSNFTILTGIVVGFYFTGEAAKQIVGVLRGTREPEHEGHLNPAAPPLESQSIGEVESPEPQNA